MSLQKSTKSLRSKGLVGLEALLPLLRSKLNLLESSFLLERIFFCKKASLYFAVLLVAVVIVLFK